MDPFFLRLGHSLFLLTLMVDLCRRISMVSGLYAVSGPMPRFALTFVPRINADGRWLLPVSAFNFSDSNAWTISLLVVALVLCGLLILGLTKKWVYWALIYLLVSLKARYSPVSMASDFEFTWWLIWFSFFPWNEIYKGDGAPVVNFGTRFFALHLVCFYCVVGLLKSGHTWASGIAVQNTLLFDFMRNPGFDWLLDWPKLTAGLTYFVRWLEILGSFGLVFGGEARAFRFILVMVFVFFHIGLGAIFHTFPLAEIGVATWIMFFPGARWMKGKKIPTPLFSATRAKYETVWKVFASLIFLFENLAALGNFAALQSNPIIRTAYQQSVDIGLRPSRYFFAPEAPTFSGWLSIQGKTKAGEIVGVDIIEEKIIRPPDYSKPSLRNGIYKDRGWSRIFYSLTTRWYDRAVAYGISSSACKRFPELKEIEILYFRQKINGTKLDPAERASIFGISCDEARAIEESFFKS